MIRAIIRSDTNVVKCIALLRRYDHTLTVGDLKSKMEATGFILEHNDHPAYDICDDLGNIDRNKCFRDLLDQLMALGADIQIRQNDLEISLEQLDNWLGTLKEIDAQVQADIDRETAAYAFEETVLG